MFDKKTSMNWKTDTQSISLEPVEHETIHTPEGSPPCPTSPSGDSELPFPPCFAGSTVTNHLQHYKCTSHTKEVKKAANFNPSRMFSGCQTHVVCLCEGEIEGRDLRALEKKLKASTSTSLIQRNPAAGI